MHKLTDFFHRHSRSSSYQSLHRDPAAPAPKPEATAFPTEADIYRHRKQRGVNLGSWFVLERWIIESPFRSAAAPGQSDLDVARGQDAKQVLEHHWDTWITRADWEWLAQHGINTVRIPIGYYHICGADASVLNGTDFAEHQHVFEGAWGRITDAISTAHQFNIGVLLDLHSAPGKQNRDSHSGTSAPTPAFFTPQNMAHTTHILTTLARHLPSLPNIVGIELLNEPQPDSHDDALRRWYTDTILSVRDAAPQMPVYISDCWRTDEYGGFVAALSKAPQRLDGVVLDHHLYRCFTGEDVNTRAEAHARALVDANAGTPSMFARVVQNLQSAGGAMVVGEFSGALNPNSLAHLGGGPAEMKARKAYLKAEIELFERYCAGWFFWTYKKESRDLGWGFRDAVEAGIWPGVGLVVRNECERDAGRSGRRNTMMDKALAEHTSYWDQYPGNYEHFRFGDGFVQGWDDAYERFLCAGASSPVPVPELGFKGPWAKRRAEGYVRAKGGAGNVWEYGECFCCLWWCGHGFDDGVDGVCVEHGLIQGVDAARRDFIQIYCEGGA
ncbi:glycoside hydrolase [Heliocybe sulcata]|uniref:Glycoside hydrolase n=1 Tax=Heliocybe sulcata TaxID=5364 RepID=A0A5C3N442_9AGAM|nr:glycoside hydrolase [Heliocybe sulcata]